MPGCSLGYAGHAYCRRCRESSNLSASARLAYDVVHMQARRVQLKGSDDHVIRWVCVGRDGGRGVIKVVEQEIENSKSWHRNVTAQHRGQRRKKSVQHL